jgi:proteic killer suppression protein
LQAEGLIRGKCVWPGYRLHALKGELKGLWSVTVSGNWRVTFRVDGGNVLDYH